MLEVCFGDSVKGALRCAQNVGGSCGGAMGIAVIGGGRLHWWQRRKMLAKARAEQRALEQGAIALGGTKEDLVGISFDESEGDIAAPLTADDCPRKRRVVEWLTADPWGEQEEMQTEAENFWQRCMADLEKLKTRAAAGEAVRIWADETPSAACGLLFAADLLRGMDCPVSVVKLPPQMERPDGTIVRYVGWGEVRPELFGSFLGGAVTLSKEQRALLAQQWKRLQEENAPLRAVQDGQVVSVGMDYYDALIRKEYPADSCRVAELIGNVLGKHRPGVGDFFIAQRIRTLLADGELTIRKNDPSRFYNTVIARA
ncbi:MAG: DUF3658 domain-containing protein [Ruthenibacterium sp.]